MHNTRIERLWFDVTVGFGGKWKIFFLELEHNDDLDADDPRHIWLVHHLFLHAINQDAQEWADIWNAHTLHVKGEPAATPHELFMFGVAEHGARGLSHVAPPAAPVAVEEQVDDIVHYGVDWDAANDPVLMRHHREHNQEGVDAEAVVAGVPCRLSEVTCDPPRCPLSLDVVAMLNLHLSHHFDLSSRDMLVRRELWRSALAFCRPWFT